MKVLAGPVMRVDGRNDRPAQPRRSPADAIDAPGLSLPFVRVSRDRTTRPNAYMSWRSCPVCGGDRHRPLFEYNDFQFYSDAAVSKQVTIRQVQCLGCFGVFMNPVFNAEGFAALFAEAGASYGSTSGRQAEQVSWLTDHGLLGAGTTLLDIGCYDGAFIGTLPDGVSGVGVDIDQPAVERARRRHGTSAQHDFICADFEQFDVDKPVDIITMFHVLEHLPRPLSVLQRLAELATPSTRLLVEVPVLENCLRASVGDVSGFLTVQHLTHFTGASLGNVLGAAGWRVIASHAMEDYNGFRIVAEPAARSQFHPEPGDHNLVLNYMSRWYATIAEVEARLRRMTASHCVLRGGGLQTEYLWHLTSLFSGDRDFVILDKDPLKKGKTWRGIPILGPECLPHVNWRDSRLVLSSYSHQDALREEARAAGVPDTTILPIYDRVCRY